MLNKKRTAVVFTANTPHVAHASLMLDSLKDENKGNFQGDIWVISTGLSVRAQNFLDSIGVKFLINRLSSLNEWKNWKLVAESIPEYEEFINEKDREESLKQAFEIYRNKRMSKLIILDWVKKFGDSYDFIALCDNDLYFQRDVHSLFEYYYSQDADRIYYWQEENEMLPGTSLWEKNFHYSSRYDASKLEFGKNEINIGFIMGSVNILYQVFCDVKIDFFYLDIELFTKYKWHDQDLVRLNRAKHPERYALVQEGAIVHICNGGMKVVEEKYPQEFYHLRTGEKPFVIHFAGGNWKPYSIKPPYVIEPDNYYFSQELKEQYDVIRKGSFQNLFDDTTDKYFTEQNKESKINARREWIKLAKNGKRKILIVSNIEAVPNNIDFDLYDIVVTGKNIIEKNPNIVYEDFPIILQDINLIIKDQYLVRTYGMQLPNIPDEFYQEMIRPVITENNHTVRETMAVTNLFFLYLSDMLAFYRPELVFILGFLKPWENIIKNICQWRGITAHCPEGLKLPEGLTFDSYCDRIGENRIEAVKDPIVSVIMPVYNSEMYLSASINSICRQTLTSFELICINNGSTDDSQAILDYFAAYDLRIRIHYQEEPNQRAARNWGYTHAKGKYVYLIDSDDYLDANALETLVNVAENKNADLVYFFFREVRTDLNTVRPRPRWYSYRRFFPDDQVFKMEQKYYKFFIQYPFPWAKLIRRDLVLENQLYFDLDCSNFDDNPHNLKVLFSAQNVYVYNGQLYNFRIHNKSMTQSKSPRIMGMIDAIRLMNEIYKKFNSYDLYARWYVPYKIHLVAWAWDMVPDELREIYFANVKKMFFPKDEKFFQDDFVWSYYEMPNQAFLNRVREMLSQSYEKFIEEKGKNLMRGFKVAIMGQMPAKGYSGGRYCAWVLAEALANEGNQVYMIINDIPEFSEDFKQYPNHKQIKVILAHDFYNFRFTESKLDYVICIPAIGKGEKFYNACMYFAIMKEARFAFVNFETPNWYQACTEIKRPEKDYKILKRMCKYGCLIFSLANESQKYALEYYNKFPKQTEYCVWSPPINSIMADKVKEEKGNQILIFLRIRDKHKGGDDFLQLLGEYLRGMTCVCVVGNGEIPQDFMAQAKLKANQYGITLKFEKGLSDYRKFQEIKRSKLLLFPSHFEGYGYPPVEALYCGTMCVVYDLPVLREISGDALTYCEMGNVSMLRESMQMLLKEKRIEPICVDTADFFKQADRLHHILEDNFTNQKLKTKRNFSVKLWGKIKKWYYVTVKKEIPEMVKYCINIDAEISQILTCSNETWKKVRKEIKGKDIYIWGCGRAYLDLYPKYYKRIKIKGILDSSPNKIGTEDKLSGKIIQNPEILRKENKDLTVVLISNKNNVDTIIEELKKYRIKYYHSLCMIEINSLEGKIYRLYTQKRGKV
ncbi:glycosyltransferase [Schaedlerella arabinosiphila]|uniref:Glycosyltransferase n=1 Tax=Schaedlerella arabinosiphila TaxID=2044587 RepID=A0A426DM53_9FIRM|nr:glycosyltransferase [Schaedlerella arabinosiphila]RRK33731.1 glycosyltransferase [Schaedlerella arabinosiphila]